MLALERCRLLRVLEELWDAPMPPHRLEKRASHIAQE